MSLLLGFTFARASNIIRPIHIWTRRLANRGIYESDVQGAQVVMREIYPWKIPFLVNFCTCRYRFYEVDPEKWGKKSISNDMGKRKWKEPALLSIFTSIFHLNRCEIHSSLSDDAHLFPSILILNCFNWIELINLSNFIRDYCWPEIQRIIFVPSPRRIQFAQLTLFIEFHLCIRSVTPQHIIILFSVTKALSKVHMSFVIITHRIIIIGLVKNL